VTTDMIGQQLAIVVDQEVISAPTVQGAITTGNGVITGSFTAQRAKDLATQLNAGALPVNLTTEQVVTVSPTLGANRLTKASWPSAGLPALMLHLLFYYRLSRSWPDRHDHLGDPRDRPRGGGRTDDQTA
jgi:preprotein translocase subunit SecD